MIRRDFSALTLALACVAAPIAMTFVAAAPGVVHAQAPAMNEAQRLYDQGRFADAAAALQKALDDGLIIGGDAIAAKELLARCLAKAGDDAGARRTFLALLRQDPLYRPDALRVPPDEMAAYDAARKVFDAEQAQARQRIPASVSLALGMATGSNSDFGEYVASGGGEESFENQPEPALGVRFPLRPRLSLELQISRLRATNEDSISTVFSASYEITALPLTLNLHYLLRDSGKLRVSGFVGGGPMLQSYVSDKFLFFGFIPLTATDSKVGVLLNGGLTAEYLFTPRLAAELRLSGRYAKASGLFEGSTLEQYEPDVTLDDRDIDFSGVGASLGLRAYIGY